jgi:GNAT superfamily N-acetyltransferase
MAAMEANMEIRNAGPEDFDLAFDYIEKLWTYNTYDRQTIRAVYNGVLENPNDFAFFLYDDGKPMGFCHGTFFNTFWLSGQTCYVSSIISNEEVRGKGYGVKLMDHAKKLAEERGCNAVVLDSGLPRTGAHRFYELYGFEKCAYCFELKLNG